MRKKKKEFSKKTLDKIREYLKKQSTPKSEAKKE